MQTRTLNEYLSEYAKSHQNPVNVSLHNVCVPAIMWSTLGFLSTFQFSENINAAHVLAAVSLVFYGTLRNVKLWGLMLILILLIFISFNWVPELRIVSAVVFIAAWIGQFYGHKIEGKKPSFLEDLLFLLIGPIWVLKKIFPKL